MLGEVQLQPPPMQQNPSDSDPLLDHQDEVEEDQHSPERSSTEIRNQEDVEAGLLPCCRICLETDSDP
ncbi:E3 ubiquitin-protein ligase march3, partial [Trifolium pratense]